MAESPLTTQHLNKDAWSHTPSMSRIPAAMTRNICNNCIIKHVASIVTMHFDLCGNGSHAAKRTSIAERVDLTQQPLARSSNSFTANKSKI